MKNEDSITYYVQDASLGREGEEARERFLDLLQAEEAGRHRLCYKYSDKCRSDWGKEY